jgi:hypothetical protein
MPKEVKTMLIPKVSNAYSLTIVKKLKDIKYTTLEANMCDGRDSSNIINFPTLEFPIVS